MALSKPLEKDVRDPCIRFAKKFPDVLHKRMHFGHGTANGWPDDLFVFANGRHWWVEFKRPGGEATAIQNETHTKMKAYRADVIVIDDEATFKALFQMRRDGAHK